MIFGGAVDALFAVFLGCIFGSFATMLIHRLPSQEHSALGSRSACPACGEKLGVRDLVPVLSWCLSKGRCRHCQARIGWRYPLTEVVTALVFLAAWWAVDGFGLAFFLLAALGLTLVIMSAIDLEHGYLPDPLQIAAFLLGLVWRFTAPGDLAHQALDALLGIVALGGTGLLVRWGFRLLRGREGFGMGDVKLLTVAGLWLGLGPAPLYLIAAGLGGAVFALIWRRLGGGREFPLGPALALALFFALVFPDAARLLS
jgi:prepilin signal peptidase PulO-like enzyme (type II secretory pathway)